MSPARIVGLDVARAVAVLGMVAAHVGNSGERVANGGWSWLWVAGGRPSSLFAVLLGVTVSMMLLRMANVHPGSASALDARRVRIRLLVRAVILVALGVAMSALGTPVVVILTHLGVMLALTTIALRWRARWLALASAVVVATGYFVVAAVQEQAQLRGIQDLPVISTLWYDFYPVLSWMGYVLAGMAVGKLHHTRAVRQVWILASGVALMIAGYGGGVTLGGTSPLPDAATGEPDWASVEPHAYTPFEIAGNLGTALVVIAVCIAAGQSIPRALWPLAAAGSMALTLYVTHLFVIAIVGEDMVWEPTNEGMVWLCVGLITFACLWRWRFSQGPIEAVTSRLAAKIADAALRSRERADAR